MVANESLIGKLDSTIILPCRILNNVTQWFKVRQSSKNVLIQTKHVLCQ